MHNHSIEIGLRAMWVRRVWWRGRRLMAQCEDSSLGKFRILHSIHSLAQAMVEAPRVLIVGGGYGGPRSILAIDLGNPQQAQHNTVVLRRRFSSLWQNFFIYT